ncbi:MAG: carbohydrate-binding family 9-like protein [Acidobacteria bacterium]|nr:carbohydrate-binding family 9-like protein [Acidobacteriota bacterium]
MILLLAAIVPGLLWDEGPQTAPVLEKAGIREIATTGDASAWSGTRIRAVAVDGASLVKADAPGVDYQASRGGATGDPWVDSNLWRESRERARTFVYEVSGPAVPLAVAEAYASGARSYFRLKQADLGAFQATLRFLHEVDAGPMEPRANFGLVDDGSPEMDEIMNLLARRNLLFEPVKSAADWNGVVVKAGSAEFPKELAAEPFKFAAAVRDRIGDDKRLVRVYGSTTTIARLYGTTEHSRLHLIQYGRGVVRGMRIRVMGSYPRVLIASLGQRVTIAEDVVSEGGFTEFTIPEFRTYAIVDLDASPQGRVASVRAEKNFALTADPDAPQWRGAPAVSISTGPFANSLPFGTTLVRSRWTADSLYLLYVCPYASLSLKPNPATDRETPQLWEWDVAEAFIGADFENIAQYREYQVSPQSEWVDLDIDVVNPKPNGGMGWNSGFEVKARIDAAKKVWYGEMRIPLQSIAAKQWRAGDRARLGLFRITGAAGEQRLVSWQPPFRRNFHVPEAFGVLELTQ